MAESGIPAAARKLIQSCIDSVETLEVLLHLRAFGDARTPERVAAELRVDPTSARRRVTGLVQAGLLAADGGGFRYAPRDRALDLQVGELASAYATHRVSVITEIYRRPSDAIRSFADAFRLRKDEDDG